MTKDESRKLADLGDTGTNYPHVRALLAYVESHIEAKGK